MTPEERRLRWDAHMMRAEDGSDWIEEDPPTTARWRYRRSYARDERRRAQWRLEYTRDEIQHWRWCFWVWVHLCLGAEPPPKLKRTPSDDIADAAKEVMASMPGVRFYA